MRIIIRSIIFSSFVAGFCITMAIVNLGEGHYWWSVVDAFLGVLNLAIVERNFNIIKMALNKV